MIARFLVEPGMPKKVDTDLRKLYGVIDVAQTKGLGTAVRVPLWNRGDHVGRRKDMSDCDEMRNQQAYATLFFGAFYDFIHLGMAGAGRHNDNMVRVVELLAAESSFVQGMTFAEQAHIALHEQSLLKEIGFQLRYQANGQVNIAGLHIVAQAFSIVADGAHRDAGGDLLESVHQGWQEFYLAEICHGQGEAAGARGRAERGTLGKCGLYGA